MDVDIDFQTRFDPLSVFKNAVSASMVQKDKLSKHPCGVFFQNIAVDPVTKLAAIPFEEAEVMGYFKVDCLHLNIIDPITSKQEIRQLMKREPNWDLLLDPVIFPSIFQIGKHYDLVQRIKPRSVQEVADVIAIIRPKKRLLLDQYLADKEKIRPKLYRQSTDDKSSFKRGHAIAYALTIVVQLHLIEQNRYK